MQGEISKKISKTKPLYLLLAVWFLSPALAFLRYGYARLAFGYLLVLAVWLSVTVYVLSTFHKGYPLILAPFVVFPLIGAVHLYRLLKTNSFEYEPKWYSHWTIILALLLLFISSIYSVKLFLFHPYTINNGSMLPTLKIGDYYFANLRAYENQNPRKGDIVFFHFNNAIFVKRIVGLPGDKVRMVNGRLNINNVEIALSPLPDVQFKALKDFEMTAKQYQESMPDGQSYAIIDISEDSPFDNTPEYLVPEDHYFVLGDNRDNSMDSRTDVGFVPRSALAGKLIE